MEVRLILFKEITSWISLNHPRDQLYRRLPFWEGRTKKTVLPSQSKPDFHFAELHSFT